MKLSYAILIILLAACGAPKNNEKRNLQDSAASKPPAGAADQIPGTPGPAGSDSTRPGAAAHNSPADSAR